MDAHFVSGSQVKDKLFTYSYILACIGNFLLFFGFYILLPVLPMYLIETFNATKSMVGIVLSCYTLAALFVRPFTAFLVDMFDRKPFYMMAYFFFVIVFISYPLVTSITLFLLMRVLHGLAFGALSTSSNTLIVDIMPSSRRGEGLGYFGMANNLAMAIGPMIGLMIHDMTGNFNLMFYTAILSGFIGFFCASMIKAPKKIKPPKEALSLDRFFLTKGMKAGVSLFLLAIPYAMTTTYVALYGKEMGINSGMGLFFSMMAVGLIISRLFSGRLVDKGQLIQIIFVGSIICTFAFILFSSLGKINLYNHSLLVFSFYFVALILGIGYGMMFPAYNTLFVNLAPNNRRATASSTYLTSWDIGIGAGLVLGGYIAENSDLTVAYFVGAVSTLISTILFRISVAPHYEKNKVSRSA